MVMPIQCSSSSLAVWAMALCAALSLLVCQPTAAETEMDAVPQETLVPLINTTNATTNATVTAAPTAAPTNSSAPSMLPSVSPSAAPTVTPSFAPSVTDCETLHYNCYECLKSRCYWCPTDGLCFNSPEYVERNTNAAVLWPGRFHNCKTPESFTQTTCTRIENHFQDPLYSAQNWIFQAVKVVPVWQRGLYGKGIRIRINDEGLETTHPEFASRIDMNSSCPGGTAENVTSNHGMTVASLLGAAGNNSNCGVGIAPEVTISSCVVGRQTREEMLLYQLDSFDISQNSWAYEGCGRLSAQQLNGNRRRRELLQATCPFHHKPFEGYNRFPCDVCNFTAPLLGSDCTGAIAQHCEWFPIQERRACIEYLDLILLKANPLSQGKCHFGVIPEATIDALAEGVTKGRGGKGIIFVFAAGNEYIQGDDTNFQGLGSNTRFTIPVAAVGKPGRISTFSTPGASVFVAAPGGDFRQSVTPIVAASPGGKCEAQADGTSFAAPVVSGVVALMLEVNPELTWRDVQQILARTAQVFPVDADDLTLAKNAAGKVHSNRYGFGIVSADAAVTMAEKWVNIGPELSLVGERQGNITIADNPQNRTRLSLYMDSGRTKFETETVYLYVKVDHSSRGHLRITLTSPGGMISVMSPGQRSENMQTGWMKFTSVRYWNEDPNGKWDLSIVDTTPGFAAECIDYDDYFFPFDEEEGSFQISCAPKHYPDLATFCIDGEIGGLQYTSCLNGDKKACDRLERFETERYNGRTGTEACCVCGGGYSPTELPEVVLQWKLVVYGHEKSTMEGFFSGVGNDVQLGKWGGRGVAYEGDRMKNPENGRIAELKAEALAGERDKNVPVAEDSVTPINEDGFNNCRSIPYIVCDNPEYSILCEILTAMETSHIDEYTLFAPSNAAFAKMETFLNSLEEETLTGVILFHGTRGSLQVSDMECGALVEMLDGTPSRHSCQKNDALEDILIQKGGGNRRNHLLPQIILADIPACNGFIHFVDNVLLPNYIETFQQ